MSKLLSRNQRGFTLLELLIAMTLSVAMVGFIGITYTSNAKKYIHSREKSQAQMRARLSLDFISDELRETGYALTWDPSPDALPFGINEPIPGASLDPQTESVTLRYATAPLTAASPSATTLNGSIISTGNTVSVNPLPFAIPANGLVALYSPPTKVSVLRVNVAHSVGDTTVTFASTPSPNDFNSGDLLVLVQENAFWVEGGNLMMRTGGANIRLASNVEDLQLALINKDETVIGDVSSTSFGGLTASQILDVRAIRVSITSRSKKPVVDMPPTVPPSLEDHDRSGETPDQYLRGVEGTTIYLRNFGVLGS